MLQCVVEEQLSGSPSLDQAQNVPEGLGIPDRASHKGGPQGNRGEGRAISGLAG